MRNLLDRLPSMLGHDFIEAFANFENFSSMDVDFRRLSLGIHPTVGGSSLGHWERKPLAFCSGGQ